LHIGIDCFTTVRCAHHCGKTKTSSAATLVALWKQSRYVYLVFDARRCREECIRRCIRRVKYERARKAKPQCSSGRKSGRERGLSFGPGKKLST
jgi:hypothetical protein